MNSGQEEEPLLVVASIQEKKTSDHHHAKDVYVLSFAFLFIFSAYSAAQNLETTVNAELGSTSMGILYVSFALVSLVSLPIVRAMGLKTALVLGTTGYWLFIASNLHTSWYTMIPASLYLGYSSAIIWVAQGTYLTCAARSHATDYNLPEAIVIGNFNGIFWAMSATAQVIGNLLSLGLLTSGKDKKDGTSLLFVVFLGSSTMGGILMCFLSRRTTPDHESAGRRRRSLLSILKSIVSPLSNKQMLLIVPFLAYSGLQRSFVWAVFTKKIVAPSLGVSGVGGAMAIYGVCGAMSSLASGWLTSGLSSISWIISSGALIQILVLLWLLLRHSSGVMGAAPALLMGAILGTGEGIFSTELSVLLGMLFSRNAEAAFSQFRFWQCSSTAAVFFLGPRVTLKAMCIAMLAVACISETCMLYLVRHNNDDNDDISYVEEESGLDL